LSIDLTVRHRFGDLVAEGFDAAVRFGEPEPSALVARKTHRYTRRDGRGTELHRASRPAGASAGSREA